MNPLGKILLLDLYNCSKKQVMSVSVCHDFLSQAVDTLGMHKLSPPFVFQAPLLKKDPKGLGGGISGWICLIESGIQIHTFTPKNFVSVDFYTCGVLNENMVDRLISLTIETFKGDEFDHKIVERGNKYYGS